MNLFSFDLLVPQLKISLQDCNNEDSRTDFYVPFGSQIEASFVDVPWKDENSDEGIKKTIKFLFKSTTSQEQLLRIGKWHTNEDFSFILEDSHSVRFDCDYRTDKQNLSGTYQIINPSMDILVVIYKSKWINKQAIQFISDARTALFGLMIFLEYRNIDLSLLS